LTETGNRSAQEPVWKNPIFWFAVALGLADGGVRNFVPATFPIFYREMGASLAQMGKTQFLFYLSSLIFGLVGGPLLAFAGLKRSAIVALGAAAFSLVLIGSAHHFQFVLIGSGLLGLAIVALVVIVSSLVSRHFQARRQSVFLLTGLSDASGSMMGPALLGWWIIHSQHWHMTWRSGYFAGASVMLMLVLWAMLVRFNRGDRGRSDDSAPPKTWESTRDVLVNSSFYAAVLLCFCHGLAQAGMVSFLGQLYVKKLHVDAGHAAYLLSLEAVGILSGRLVFGSILARRGIPELLMIAACASVETAAFLATILSPSYYLGAAMFLVGGFFMSPTGPSLNSYLGGRLANRVATAFALFAALGNVGAALGPYLIGTIGSDFGIERGILLAPLFSALLSATALIWYLREKRILSKSEIKQSSVLV
jgi:MFS transporter, FSR family, fosmidomycin resistance protein